MKKILFTALAALSLNAFSQSYVIMDNGVTLTTDKAGFVYDFGHYTAPHKILLKGGQYMLEEGGILTTIDDKGILFRKYEVLPKKIAGKGLNYFIGEGLLYTIDSLGMVTVSEDDIFKSVTKFGGNFFVVDNQHLFTVDSFGQHIQVQLPDFRPTDIVSFGGNYFMSNRGILYTVSADGAITPKTEDRVGIIVKKGGNYFVDTLGVIYTVSADGSLQIPAIPMNLKVTSIVKMGMNYFIDSFGAFYAVDQDGKVYERYLGNFDFRNSHIVSL